MVLPEPAATYAEVRHLMMDTLRTTHPEWENEVLDAYELRIVTWFKLLELTRDQATSRAR